MSQIDPRLLALAKTPLRSTSLRPTITALHPPTPELHLAARADTRVRSVPACDLPAPAVPDRPGPAATPCAAPHEPAARRSMDDPVAETAAVTCEPATGPAEPADPAEPMADAGQPPAAEEADADRRNNGRKKQLVPAAVTWRGLKQAPLTAVVKDMSMTGVRLQMPPKKFGVINSVSDVPDHFILILRNEQIQYECEVAWRNNGQLGARFLGAGRPLAAEYKTKRGF